MSTTWMHRWTPVEIAWLRVYRPRLVNLTELTYLFNRRFGLFLSVSAVDGACARYGIQSGRTGRFR